MEPTEPISRNTAAAAHIGSEGPIDERAPTEEEGQEQDQGPDTGLEDAIENLSLVGEERIPFKEMRASWLNAAVKAYETFLTPAQNASVRILGSVPHTPEQWETLGRNLFDERVLKYIRAGDPVITSGLVKLEDGPEKLLNWVQEHEMALMKGFRSLDWIDPMYTEDLEERRLAREVYPIDVGTRFAVVLAFFTEHAKDDANTTLLVLDLLATEKGSANRKTAERRKQMLEKQTIAMIKAEERSQGMAYTAYRGTNHPRFAEPTRATVHGDRLALLWRDVPSSFQDPERRTVAMRDTLEISTLPRCDPREAIRVEFEKGAILDYDICFPYMVVRCAGAMAVGVLASFRSQILKAASKPADIEALSKDEICKKNTVVLVLSFTRADTENVIVVDDDCTIIGAAISPSMRFPADLNVLPQDYKVICSIDSANPRSGKRGTLLSVPLLPIIVSERGDPEMLTAAPVSTRICADEEQELKEFEVAGKRYKSKAVEAPSLLQQFPGGHLVQITPNNVGIYIDSSPPVFPESHIYVCRDAQVVDMAIYCNMIVSLTPDNKVEFATIRHATPEEAKLGIKPSSVWRLSDLKRQGDREHTEPKDETERAAVGNYKAIWMTSDRVKVLFPDGTVVTFTGLNDEEVKRYKEVERRSRHEAVKRAAVKAESERQVHAELARQKQAEMQK